MENRYLDSAILSDLNDQKMVFIGGPRQVGKTTLSKQLGSGFKSAAYFNWDNRADRKVIMEGIWPAESDLIILDELHKYRLWKRHIKGEFDKHREKYKFIVTGSARMDVFRKGGDSLQGRYHHYRLHPFTLAELENCKHDFVPFRELPVDAKPVSGNIEALDRFGGFPEPFTKENDRFLRRWHNEKLDRMFREDIMDMAVIRDLGNIRLLSEMLPARVGSLLSTNTLREDLEVSFKAVAHWLDVLETFYYQFRIYPFTHKSVRSIKKEPKLYLWDWSEIKDEPKRFENFIASHLLKFVHYLHDFEGYNAELCFLRDLNKKEVDFLVVVDKKPWFAVEVKTQDKTVSSALKLFKEKWKIPFCYQVVKTSGVDLLAGDVRIISADKFLCSLV